MAIVSKRYAGRDEDYEPDVDTKFWACGEWWTDAATGDIKRCNHTESIKVGDGYRSQKECPKCGGTMTKEY